jgi:hypothetical protein
LKGFAEISFDQLHLELTQKPNQATVIQDFSLISPELRLNGDGSIANVPGQPLQDRPLRLDVQMAVRGQQASNFRLLGLLKDQPDELGYSPLVDKFRLEGSLSDMRSSALTQLLQQKLGAAP